MTRYQSSKKFEQASFNALPKAFQKGVRIFPAKPPAPVLTKPVKKAINRMISRTEEVKWAPNLTLADRVVVGGMGLRYNGTTNLNGWSSGPSQINGILPLIPQGVSESDRVGNKIRVKNFKVKFSLKADPTTDASSTVNYNPFRGVPFLVRVIVYRHRYADDDYSQNNILQAGSTSLDLSGNVDDYFKPYNKDEYKIYYSKQFQMIASTHSNVNGVIADNTLSGKQSYITRTCNIKIPKILRYNDNTTVATNAGMYMAVAVCNTDGTAIANTQHRVTVNAESYLSFTDS